MKKQYIAPHIEVIHFTAEAIMQGTKSSIPATYSKSGKQVLSNEREYSSSIWDGMNDE